MHTTASPTAAAAAAYTLAEARADLSRELVSGRFSTCPCCTGTVKVYRRTLTTSMLVALRLLVGGSAGSQPLHIDKFLSEHVREAGPAIRGDASKLRHWGLLERDPEQRGFYRVTSLAHAFVRGEVAIPRCVYLYQGLVMGLHPQVWHVSDFDAAGAFATAAGHVVEGEVDAGLLAHIQEAVRSYLTGHPAYAAGHVPAHEE